VQRTTAAATSTSSTPIAPTAPRSPTSPAEPATPAAAATSAMSSLRRVGDLLSPRSTPGGFRLGAVIATAICALCGLFAATAIAARDGSLDAAATAARQLVDVQEVRTAAVEADSIAASSFLAPTEAQADQRDRYEQRLADATRALAVVAQRAPSGDVEALATANDTLATFAGLIEQSRANNRQGFPVGAAYQRQASALVRTDLLPALDAVDLASRDRLNSSLGDSTRNAAIAVALIVVALVALVAASWQLFRRTRRIVNVPIAIGAVLTIVALVWSAFTLLPTGRTIEDTVDTSLRSADALSRARASAFDARSAEALTLINRGSGAANEASWQLADAEVAITVEEACRSAGDCFDGSWQAYRAVHVEVRRLDDGGDYDAAVDLALGDAAARFTDFADQAGEAQATRAAQVTDGFDDARAPLGLLRWVVLVAGLGAAASVLIGYGQRLREYR